jgi:hypothetical protein
MICEKCLSTFSTPFGSNRFCSIQCSNSRKMSDECKNKIKTSLLLKNKGRVKNQSICEECLFTNISMFNGWDADVIIPEYKLAILWNGKWHYEQICKGHSLSQVQNRDKIKISEIIQYGYIPYIIQDLGKCNKSFVHDQFRILQKYISLNF